MNLANYLKKEEEYLPWKSAFDAFQYIDSMLASTPSTYEAFKVIVSTFYHSVHYIGYLHILIIFYELVVWKRQNKTWSWYLILAIHDWNTITDVRPCYVLWTIWRWFADDPTALGSRQVGLLLAARRLRQQFAGHLSRLDEPTRRCWPSPGWFKKDCYVHSCSSPRLSWMGIRLG